MKIAVAIIHGIGEQKADFAEGIMEELSDRFASLVGANTASPQNELVMEPVYWSPVLQDEENKLLKRLLAGGELDFVGLRKFKVNFAADAIAYQPRPRNGTSTTKSTSGWPNP